MSAETLIPESPSEKRDDALLAEFRRLGDQSDRLHRFASYVCGFGILSIALVGSVNMFHPLAPHHPGFFSEVYSGGYLLMYLPVLAASRFRRRRLKTLMAALRHDARAIGPIVEVCHLQAHSSIVHQAVTTLISLLPRMEADDCRLLSDHQMGMLMGFLSPSQKPNDPITVKRSLFQRCFAPLTESARSLENNRIRTLTPVLLKALERSGDSRAIPAVKRLATSTLHTLFQKEAQECLAVLQREAPERDKQRFLLLPSSEHAVQEPLLRPIASRPEAQPELLLRATSESADR